MMSELTPCNYCTLRRIRERAKVSGVRVTVLRDAKWGLGGVNVYVHPVKVNVRKLREYDRGKYRAAWFMEVGQSCEC